MKLRLEKLSPSMAVGLIEGMDGGSRIFDFFAGLATWSIPSKTINKDKDRQWLVVPASFRSELEKIVSVWNSVCLRQKDEPVLLEVIEADGCLSIVPKNDVSAAELVANANAFGKYLQSLPAYFDWECPE